MFSKSSNVKAVRKKSKVTSGRYLAKVKYLWSFIINFAVKIELKCQSDIAADLDIKKYSNITRRMFEDVELKEGDGGWWERRYKQVFGGSLFSMTKPSSTTQAGATKRLLKLYKDWRYQIW